MNRITSVIIIEDSALMRRELTRIIDSDPGCRVVGSAVDAEEGLDKILRYNPDVVTLDINLPGINGIQVLEKMKTANPETPVITTSWSRRSLAISRIARLIASRRTLPQ